MCRVIKGVFKRWPALPKYQETWDANVVLDHITSWPETQDLTLKQLILRTVMLLSLLTGQRGQAFHSLNVSDLRFSSQKCVIVVSEKHKHTKPGVHTKLATILEFPDKDKLFAQRIA